MVTGLLRHPPRALPPRPRPGTCGETEIFWSLVFVVRILVRNLLNSAVMCADFRVSVIALIEYGIVIRRADPAELMVTS
jgi:hypothetical protein